MNELAVRAAMDYVERALERRADAFAVSLEEARDGFFTLQAARARTPEWLESANAWLNTNLTASGRAKMLGALRRRRAGGSQTSMTVRLPRTTRGELVSLAAELDIPPNVALAGLLHLVRCDKELQGELKQFAAARAPRQ